MLLLSFNVCAENQVQALIEPEAQDDSTVERQKIEVIGGMSENIGTFLAPKRISKEQIEIRKFTDVTRALRQTTGVYVREEEGHGLRPNIGLRGTNPDRSKKVVIMEDGVLIGPAP